ncbi:OLC1v1018820C1 [Oldenlandia corymbosa var. corymbosa]|uniref:OLC1v1018820C1 n=1 Tax=Oldenlandia corymbosa var. corymbosa TaxID=529605 RepID=A0AAV1ECG5_OLDCO|nr:OLC1v1018820C1 [Oldenlandia corymbosa var. corymbosa]
MGNGFRRIAKIKDDASLQVLYFLPNSTYIDLYVDLEVAGTSRSHLEVGTSSGGPNVENVDYMEDDDVGGPNMEDGDHMEDNHAEDDEDYTSISDQSDENQSISEGSWESDEEVEDKFATRIGTYIVHRIRWLIGCITVKLESNYDYSMTADHELQNYDMSALIDSVCVPGRLDGIDIITLWVWERIPRLQPMRKVKDQNYLVPDAPLGNRWKCPKSKANIAAHYVAGIRDQLSSLRDGDDVDLCWAIREPYEPNRVLRQFQCKQTVPEYPLINDIDRWNAIHHGCLGTGKAYDDWVQKHTESSNLSDVYHLVDAALQENPGLGGSLEDKLLQIFDKNFSALTLGPRDMSTQNDTKVLQKRPPESSQPVVLT